jgi:hypothetical protein
MQTEKTESELAAEKEIQEMIEAAKKHGVDEVYKLTVPINEEYVEALVKYPSLNAYSIGLTLEDTNPLKGKLIVLNDMFLEGDRRMLEPEKSTMNMKIFLRACTAIDRIVDLKTAMIKKKSLTVQ